jgi:hypothetical protein
VKIEATTIALTRAEGRHEDCVTVTVTSSGVVNAAGRPVGRYVDGANVWRRADAVLAAWSHSAPRTSRYHKCDFVVTYADGETYQGRYDLVRMCVDGYPSIERHMLSHCGMSSGRAKPAHLTQAQWDGYLSEIVGVEHQAEYARFLDTYQIGGAS